jgi:hypothetical protein
MPYEVIMDAENCDGHAVVKVGTKEAIDGGCHAEHQEAIDHMTALNIVTKEERQEVNLVAPSFMKMSAKRGLALHAEGESGDGLVPATVADARKMVEGTALSEGKWRRIAPWIARHIGDLDAVQGDEITPGLVAMLLWGGGSSKSSARRAQAYAERIVAQLDSTEERYDPDQPREEDGKFGEVVGGGGGGNGDSEGDGEGSTTNDPVEVELKIEDHQQQYVDKISITKVEAIDAYSAGGHEDINKILRGGPPPPPQLDDEEAEEVEIRTERIISAIEKAPGIPEEITVYRGANLKSLGVKSDQSLESLVGKELFDDGIISTSFDKTQASGFATGNEVLFEIKVPAGVKGLALAQLSNFPQEREFLLSPGGFRVAGIKDAEGTTPTVVLERIRKSREG